MLLCAKEKFALNTQLSLTHKTHNISYSLLAFDPSYIASNSLTYNMTYHRMFWHVGVENMGGTLVTLNLDHTTHIFIASGPHSTSILAVVWSRFNVTVTLMSPKCHREYHH